MAVDRSLRAALSGVRGLLLDLDGVLILRSAPLPGAAAALAALDSAGVPYVIGTNTSLVSRATLAAGMARWAVPVPAERMLTAASVAAAYTRRHFAGRPLYVLAAPDALAEFDGQRLLSHEEAARDEATAAAVVVGDAAEDFTPANMQSAFRLLRAGARFVAMHKNRWWQTPEGDRLDAGAYVVGLEFALERRALVTGKPSRAFFAQGVRLLNSLAAPARGAAGGIPALISASEVAMVGDDLWNDILGARRAGLPGIFVKSGKQGDPELARFSARNRPPDGVAPSIAEVAAALAR